MSSIVKLTIKDTTGFTFARVCKGTIFSDIYLGYRELTVVQQGAGPGAVRNDSECLNSEHNQLWLALISRAEDSREALNRAIVLAHSSPSRRA